MLRAGLSLRAVGLTSRMTGDTLDTELRGQWSPDFGCSCCKRRRAPGWCVLALVGKSPTYPASPNSVLLIAVPRVPPLPEIPCPQHHG